MGSSTIRRVFDQSTDAFNRHDMKAFMANCTDDVTCDAPGLGRLQGREAVGAFYGAWIEGFPDAHVDLREVSNLEDGILEEGTFSETHRGVLHTPSGDLPPTNRSVREHYVQVVRMRGEKICSFDLTYDRLGMLEQLGMAPGAGAGKAMPSRGAEARP